MNIDPNAPEYFYTFQGREVKLTVNEAAAKNAGLMHNMSADRYVLVTKKKDVK